MITEIKYPLSCFDLSLESLPEFVETIGKGDLQDAWRWVDSVRDRELAESAWMGVAADLATQILPQLRLAPMVDASTAASEFARFTLRRYLDAFVLIGRLTAHPGKELVSIVADPPNFQSARGTLVLGTHGPLGESLGLALSIDMPVTQLAFSSRKVSKVPSSLLRGFHLKIVEVSDPLVLFKAIRALRAGECVLVACDVVGSGQTFVTNASMFGRRVLFPMGVAKLIEYCQPRVLLGGLERAGDRYLVHLTAVAAPTNELAVIYFEELARSLKSRVGSWYGWERFASLIGDTVGTNQPGSILHLGT